MTIAAADILPPLMGVDPHYVPDAPVLALYLPGAHEAATYYRLRVPLCSAFGDENVAFGPITPELWPRLLASAHRADLVVISRIMRVRVDGGGEDQSDTREIFRALRHSGARVAVDIDDDLHTRAHRSRYMTPADYASFEAYLRTADARTCTNATLANRLTKFGRVGVVPNYVRPDWTPPQPHPGDGGPVVICLTGSVSHDRDWRIVAPALRAVRARYGDAVRLRVVGHQPAYLADLIDEAVPWGGRLADYPGKLAGAHIGLCPLPDSGFNRCKSPIKAYEYALAGAAVIGSPTQYGPALADGRGQVVRDGADWLPAIARFIEDAPARRAAAQSLQAYVTTALDARQHAAAIRAAYHV